MNFLKLISLFLLFMPFSYANAEDVPSEIVHALAPHGQLRCAINLGNPVLAQAAADTGNAPEGVSVQLGRELARRLNVPIQFITYDAAGKVSAAVKDNAWDIAFLAIDTVRATTLTFSNPYVLIEGTYLVPADSPIKTLDDVDRPGIQIAVGRGSAYDLYLTRALQHATRVEVATSAQALAVLMQGHLDAAAGVRQPLEAFARLHPEYRVLPGKFMSIRQALVMPKRTTLDEDQNQIGSHYLNSFIEEMKASGFVAKALADSKQADAIVAPAGN